MPARRTRVPRECQHRRKHEHGTELAYIEDGCGCDDCVEASRRVKAYRRMLSSRGVKRGVIPARPVYDHIRSLTEQGMAANRIAEAAGVNEHTIARILRIARRPSSTATMRWHTADLILRVRFEPGPTDIVDSTGATRRLEALMAIGWWRKVLAPAIGIPDTALDKVIRGQPVWRRTVEQIAAAYEQLWDTPPDCPTPELKVQLRRQLDRARKHGYAPPMAWDDTAIDNPRARPRGVVLEFPSQQIDSDLLRTAM
jgi:transcriptional regulator with XRE-family HTH domain